MIKFPANSEEAYKFSTGNIRKNWNLRNTDRVARAIVRNQLELSRKFKSGIK